MIFQHTYQQILDKEKTQTRRLRKSINTEWGTRPIDCLVKKDVRNFFNPEARVMLGEWVHFLDHPPNKPDALIGTRLKWQVGRSYAVQPGRGKESVGRILLTGIGLERLQSITEDDAIAEGFASAAHFRVTWELIHNKPGKRWDDNPLVWVLTFERA